MSYLKTNQSGIIKSLMLGLIAGAVVLLGICAAGAKGVLSGILPEKAAEYVAFCAVIFSAYTSARISAWMYKEKKLQVCILSALLEFAVLLAIFLILQGEKLVGVGPITATVIGGSLLSLLNESGKRSGKRRKSKYKTG